MLMMSGFLPSLQCAGYTTLDFALKLDPTAQDSLSIVRMIEQRGKFSGWLNMKVRAYLWQQMCQVHLKLIV